jgi:hypothetical protein
MKVPANKIPLPPATTLRADVAVTGSTRWSRRSCWRIAPRRSRGWAVPNRWWRRPRAVRT